MLAKVQSRPYPSVPITARHRKLDVGVPADIVVRNAGRGDDRPNEGGYEKNKGTCEAAHWRYQICLPIIGATAPRGSTVNDLYHLYPAIRA